MSSTTATVDDTTTPEASAGGYRCVAHGRALDDHEQRLRHLERAHYRQMALVGLITAAASLAGSYFGSRSNNPPPPAPAVAAPYNPP